MFLFKNTRQIAIEINSYDIKMVKYSFGKLHLKQCVSQPLPAKVMEKGRLLNVAPVILLLQQWVATTNTQGWSAAMTLPLNQVLIKRLQLPRTLRHAECQWQIQQQLAHYFPGITLPGKTILQDELCFDFLRHKNTDEVILIAAKKKLCQLYQEIAQAAQLQLNRLEVDILPLLRCLLSTLGDEEEAIGVFDIGLTEVNFIVLFQKQLFYSETTQLNQLIQACQFFSSIHHHVTLKKIWWIGDATHFDAIQAQLKIPCEKFFPKTFPLSFIKTIGLLRKYRVRN